jgi:hypothetical protein
MENRYVFELDININPFLVWIEIAQTGELLFPENIKDYL